MAELPTTWEEMGEMSKKIKADGVAQYPIVFQAGVGSEHIGETWYHLVTSIGGKVFDEEFNPLLEEGSKARQMLQWWRDTIQEWEIADPRSLELRWIPAAKAMATGEYVFCNTQPRFMRFANLPEESPTAGQHKLFACGTPMSHGLLWAMGAEAGSKEYAWEMLKYFGAQTMAGDWLMPIERAKLSYASGWPEKAADDPGVNELWSQVWDIDEYKRQFSEAPFVAETVPAMRTLWYLQWVEQVLVPNLQDCLGGKITADEAAGNLAKGAEDLKAQEG
jgi:multiple sugar transport system substrate-binding protein